MRKPATDERAFIQQYSVLRANSSRTTISDPIQRAAESTPTAFSVVMAPAVCLARRAVAETVGTAALAAFPLLKRMRKTQSIHNKTCQQIESIDLRVGEHYKQVEGSPAGG